jgi:hypothetical protein
MAGGLVAMWLAVEVFRVACSSFCSIFFRS